MKSFIPYHIYKNHNDSKFNASFNSVTMFLDISGFTRLTEELMKHDKYEGAELLNNIISSIFEPVIDIVYSYGGFISTFEGDAFTGIFENTPPIDVLYCAKEIMTFMIKLCRNKLFTKIIVFCVRSCLKPFILITLVLQISCTSNPSNIKFYNEDSKQYFIEIALGSEFGDNNNVIVKRYTDVRIYILGEKPDYLMEELYRIIEELNKYTGIIKLKLVEELSDSNFIIFFGEGSYYAKNIEREAERYIENNFGLFFIRTNSSYDIISGSMYVDIYRTDSKNAQKHLLREELTQSLGLLNDSYKYNDSIFYQGWSETTEYLEIDSDIIKILYSDSIISGMNEEVVRKVLGIDY